MANRDPYEVIGVSTTATAEEIKKKYRELAKKYHPDNYTDPTMKKRAESRMAEINQAYDTLSDPDKRARYDQQQRFNRYNPYGGAYGPFGQNPYQGQGQQGNPYRGNPYQGDPYQGGQQNRNPYGGYNPYGNMYGGSGSCCNGLMALCCADTLCECMGGDLCPGC